MDEIDLEIQQLREQIAALKAEGVPSTPQRIGATGSWEEDVNPVNDALGGFAQGALTNLAGPVDWATRQGNKLTGMLGMAPVPENGQETMRGFIEALGMQPEGAAGRVAERAGELTAEVPKFLAGGAALKGAQGLGMVGRGLARAGNFITQNPVKQSINTALGGTAGGLAKEGGATPNQQMATELMIMLAAPSAEGIANVAKRGLSRPVAEVAADRAAKFLRKIGEVPGAELSKTAPELQAEIASVMTGSGASKGAVQKLMGGVDIPVAEARGRLLQADAAAQKVTAGNVLDSAKSVATKAFDTLSRADKAAAWRVTAKKLESTGKSMMKGMPEEQEVGAFLLKTAKRIKGIRLKNGAYPIDKQVMKWKSPSMDDYYNWRQSLVNSSNPNARRGIQALDTLMKKGTPPQVAGEIQGVMDANAAFREQAGRASLVNTVTKGQGDLAAGAGKSFALSPERVVKNLITKGAEPVRNWMKSASPQALSAERSGLVADLAANVDSAPSFVNTHKDALKELFGGSKNFKLLVKAFGEQKNSAVAKLAQMIPYFTRQLYVKAAPALVRGAIGGTAGGMLGGSEGAVMGLALGSGLGLRAASKSAKRQADISLEFGNLVEEALRGDSKLFSQLISKPTPGLLTRLLRRIGVTGANVTPATMGAIEGGYDETTDMGTESFPKKKLTTEPMTTSKTPEVKLAPVRYSPDLVKLQRAVITQESGGNPTAMSRAGAQGLMQLMPETGKDMMRRLGLDPKEYDPYNPDLNKQLGTEYLRMLRGRYDGDIHLALAAYNWGMGNLERAMKKHGTRDFNELVKKMGIGGRYGMPRETAEYVPRVLANLHKINTLEV